MIFGKWEMLWVWHEQQTMFKKLYKELENHQWPMTLMELKTFLDSKNVIRVAAGLEHSLHHEWETTYPIYYTTKWDSLRNLWNRVTARGLPTKEVWALCWTLPEKGSMSWGKRFAAHVVQQCFPCGKKPWVPIEQSLPEFHESRLGNRSMMAFNEIGMDHAGPFNLNKAGALLKGTYWQ